MLGARLSAVVVAFSCLVYAPTGAAQTADDRERATARDLGQAGIEDLRNERHDAASEKLERAYALVKAPTLGLWSGRALVKLGKLVEAAERFLEVTRLPDGERNPEVQAKARQDAAADRDALLPRIPKLRLVVSGAEPAEVTVLLDGATVDPPLVGVEQPVNPGGHSIEARRGDQVVERTVELAEGASQTIELVFAEEPAVAPPPVAREPKPTPVAPTPSPTSDARADDPPPASSSTQRTLGWLALGVGAVGLTAGTVSRVIAAGKKDDLDPVCRNDVCPHDRSDDVDSYNRARIVSNVSYGVGAVGVGLGAVLLLTAPLPREAPAEARWEPWVGPTSAGVRGVF